MALQLRGKGEQANVGLFSTVAQYDVVCGKFGCSATHLVACSVAVSKRWGAHGTLPAAVDVDMSVVLQYLQQQTGAADVAVLRVI